MFSVFDLLYFLTGWRMSSTFPMSPFLASRSEVSQPPSLLNPMLVIAWSATWRSLQLINRHFWETFLRGLGQRGVSSPKNSKLQNSF